MLITFRGKRMKIDSVTHQIGIDILSLHRALSVGVDLYRILQFTGFIISRLCKDGNYRGKVSGGGEAIGQP